MKFELLIIYYVSFLNSLKIERQEKKDIIFGVTKDDCENTLFGKKKVNYCVCKKRNDTFFSGKNDQYKCNNEKYLGRLF